MGPPGGVAGALTCSAEQPVMQGLPQPRATTAAWLVIPPSCVSTPSEVYMPLTSSGLVSLRTSTTFSPASFHSSACSALKHTCAQRMAALLWALASRDRAPGAAGAATDSAEGAPPSTGCL
jgi:hypothetical protein